METRIIRKGRKTQNQLQNYYVIEKQSRVPLIWRIISLGLGNSHYWRSIGSVSAFEFETYDNAKEYIKTMYEEEILKIPEDEIMGYFTITKDSNGDLIEMDTKVIEC